MPATHRPASPQTLALSVGIFAAGGTVALHLFSTGELVKAFPGFGHLHISLATWGWVSLLLFGCLWLLCYVRHVQHCTVAGAVSIWYHADDKWYGEPRTHALVLFSPVRFPSECPMMSAVARAPIADGVADCW